MKPVLHRLRFFAEVPSLVRKTELHFQQGSLDAPFVVYGAPANFEELRLLERKICAVLVNIGLDREVCFVQHLAGIKGLPAGVWSGVVVGAKPVGLSRQRVENLLFEFR
jgi:hypothetical protein